MDIPSTDRKSTASTSAYPSSTVIADRYVIERVLGRGGMATVYLCTDQRTGTKVAVKVLRQELGSTVVIERFLREIAFASELDHPRIPKVLDSGVIGDLPYYVMTYIEGESLKTRLEREKQLPIADAVSIACQVIEPTTYAHRHGIVHRDIKPDNILVASDGVYVLDFGIARAIIESGVDRLTSTGIGVGTAAYVSPEQALGDRSLDARSDIYSLGCVVYEMIAGIPPFVGPTTQVIISRRFAAPPPPLSEVRDGVPQSLERVILRALARAPADRWESAAEFGAALSSASRNVERMSAALPSAFRSKASLRIGSVVLLVGLVAMGILLWSRNRAPPLEEVSASIAGWNFTTAKNTLMRAVKDHPRNPRVQLWLAQTMMLQGDEPSHWKPYILFAADHRLELEASDQKRMEALVAFSSSAFAPACSLFDELARANGGKGSNDFTPQLARADCLRKDGAVLPDGTSRSGYRFRTSFHLADSLYEGLLARYSTTPAAYEVIIPRLEKVLSTDKSQLRTGLLSGPKPRLFLAHPSLDADSLEYIPFPVSPGGPIWTGSDPAGVEAVLIRNRDRLRALVTNWCRIAPNDPDAHETLAIVLESATEFSGNRNSALEQLKIARQLASNNAGGSERSLRQIRLASQQVRLYLRLNRFQQAGILADSVLARDWLTGLDEAAVDQAAEKLAVLSALRGRGFEVVKFEESFPQQYWTILPNGEQTQVPSSIGLDASRLMVYAEFGGPRDSLVAVLARLARTMSVTIRPGLLPAMRMAILRRPLALAAPLLGAGPVVALGPTSDLFSLALKAFGADDGRRVKSFLDSLAHLHGDYAAGEISMDVVYQEAWLRSAIGERGSAMRQMDNALDGLAAALPSILQNPTLAAYLVRVMALEAELAAQSGRVAVAKQWANAVVQLWGWGDQTTAPTVARMRALQ
jgi:serine/threonine protein kinase